MHVFTDSLKYATCGLKILWQLTFLFVCRRKKASNWDSAASLKFNINQSGKIHENSDGLTETGQGSYNMTQCPVYESTTNEAQLHQTEVQSNPYEL